MADTYLGSGILKQYAPAQNTGIINAQSNNIYSQQLRNLGIPQSGGFWNTQAGGLTSPSDLLKGRMQSAYGTVGGTPLNMPYAVDANPFPNGIPAQPSNKPLIGTNTADYWQPGTSRLPSQPAMYGHTPMTTATPDMSGTFGNTGGMSRVGLFGPEQASGIATDQFNFTPMSTAFNPVVATTTSPVSASTLTPSVAAAPGTNTMFNSMIAPDSSMNQLLNTDFSIGSSMNAQPEGGMFNFGGGNTATVNHTYDKSMGASDWAGVGMGAANALIGGYFQNRMLNLQEDELQLHRDKFNDYKNERKLGREVSAERARQAWG